MRLIITLLLGCLLWQPALAAPVPTENQLKQELKQAESSKNAPNQAETTEALQSALNWLTERKESQTRSEQYQRVIDDFPKMTQELRRQLVLESNKILPNGDDLPAAELEQQILQTSSLLLEQARLLQQEQDRTREISDSLGQLPQQQTDARRALTEVQRRLQAQPANPNSRPRPWQGRALPTELFPPGVSMVERYEILHRYGVRIIREILFVASP